MLTSGPRTLQLITETLKALQLLAKHTALDQT